MVTTRIPLELAVNTKAAIRLKEIASEVGALLVSDSPIYRLSSGAMSNYYFDGKKLVLSSKGAHHVGKMVLDELSDMEVDAVGGLVIGAALIVAAVAAVADIEGKTINTFIVREKPKEHGTQKLIEGHLSKGSRVAIVDDVITTGTSVLKAIRAVEAQSCKVVKVIALVDRHDGGSDELRSQGYDLQTFLNWSSSGGVTIELPTVARK